MPRKQNKLLDHLENGFYLVTQNLMTTERFKEDQIRLMVAMGVDTQVGSTLVGVINGKIEFADGPLPESFLHLVLTCDPEKGFRCLEPEKKLVVRYSYVPVTTAMGEADKTRTLNI